MFEIMIDSLDRCNLCVCTDNDLEIFLKQVLCFLQLLDGSCVHILKSIPIYHKKAKDLLNIDVLFFVVIL